MVILVSGLPSSGNRLVQTHITRGVDAAEQPETVMIWHGQLTYPDLYWPRNWPEGERERLVMVIPIRCEHVRQLSVARRIKQDGGSFPTDVAALRRNILALVVERELPVYFLSYEGLIANPNDAGRKLFEWLDLPWIPWPTTACADEPYRGRIFDGNARYV